MKSNPNIDELLCSFIDGELPARQKTEVQRMAARDPEVSKRLRQLENCRNLVSALPRAEAPDDMIDQIRLSLERRTLLGERQISSSGRAGRWHLRMRRLMAAAAMIALLVGLGLVVYQIISPIAPGEVPGIVANSDDGELSSGMVDPPVVVASNAGFTGKLEFRTAAMDQANSVIEGAIRENGLAEMVAVETGEGQNVYEITCSRKAAERLMADLRDVWSHSESTTLVAQSDQSDEEVVLDSVTLAQATMILGQDSTEACVAAARLENFAKEMPGQRLLDAAGENVETVIAAVPPLPRPRFVAANVEARVVAPEDDDTVETTFSIVLTDAR